MNGLETQSFSEALRLEAEREATYDADEQFARPFSYFSRGLYARHLSHYLSRFPSEHILVLRFEDLAGSPARVAAAVHEFLGVSRRPIDGERTAQVNSAEGERSCFERELRDLRTRYLEPNRQLSVLLSRPFWEY